MPEDPEVGLFSDISRDLLLEMQPRLYYFSHTAFPPLWSLVPDGTRRLMRYCRQRVSLPRLLLLFSFLRAVLQLFLAADLGSLCNGQSARATVSEAFPPPLARRPSDFASTRTFSSIVRLPPFHYSQPVHPPTSLFPAFPPPGALFAEVA